MIARVSGVKPMGCLGVIFEEGEIVLIFRCRRAISSPAVIALLIKLLLKIERYNIGAGTCSGTVPCRVSCLQSLPFKLLPDLLRAGELMINLRCTCSLRDQRLVFSMRLLHRWGAPRNGGHRLLA